MTRRRVPWQPFLALALLSALFLISTPNSVVDAAGFPVYVTTSPITGQEGKVLLISAQPEGGGEMKVACTPIDAAIFETPNLQLKEMPLSGNPCEPGAPDAFLMPGNTTITAGVYIGGSQTADKEVSATVDIQDESTWKLDGVGLSAGTAGDSDCDRETDSVDALHVLRNVAGIGLPASCLGAGNLKCDDGVTSVDSLFILRHVASLPLNLPAGCPSPFAAPALVSPEDGAVLTEDGNWHADLDWDPVAGAPKYTVQVDCEHCCVVGQFCSDVGQAAHSPVAVVTETDHTAHLVAANVERWRVWAINDDGTPGDFSEWRTFDIEVPAP